jgi:hypothetical protein
VSETRKNNLRDWFDRYWLAIIGGVFLLILLPFLALLPFGLGFMEVDGFVQLLVFLAVAAYPILYGYCTLRTVQMARRREQSDWWGHVPIVYFGVLLLVYLLRI